MVAPITERLRGKFQRGLATWCGRRTAELLYGKPLISFSFDDFPCSSLDIAGRMLEDHGWAGTYYASLELMGTEAPTGRIFDLERLRSVRSRGHELGCHTFSHCDSWETPPDVFEASVIRNAAALNQLLPGELFTSHSYPISCPKPGSKRRLAKYFPCCRGGGQTFNQGKVDLNYLKAFFIEKSRDDLPTVRDLIRKNVQQGGWLIFATHDVCDQPTRFGCTPDVFDQILNFCRDSGSAVLPVHQALERALKSNSQSLSGRLDPS